MAKPPVLRSLPQRMDALGFHKDGSSYVIDLADGIAGWVGFNRSGLDNLTLYPVVGVCSARIHHLLCQFCNPKPTCPAPTLSSPLGYLMPQATAVHWVFEDETRNANTMDSMMNAIRDYGLPFMTSNASHARMRQLIDDARFTLAPVAKYDKPLLEYVVSGRAAALKALRELEARLPPSTDAGTTATRTFIRNFSDWIHREGHK